MASRLDITDSFYYSHLESSLYMTPTISNRVKELRTARGWTQEQLAHAAHVSRYVPSLELALTFARLFECSTDTIFQLETEK